MAQPFNLGRWADAAQGAEKQPASVSADRFTTHAVVIGMTGSGKTGLIVDVLEEASLAGVPALVIDPKGDLVNRRLVFPEMRPQDFEPYCAAGKAEETAGRWRQGLADWGLDAGAARSLAASEVRIFTPGSTVSPVNILDRFSPPPEGDSEAMDDKALGAVSSLFALASLEDDPATSPEGLLLSQLLMKAWTEGRAPSLEELVQQVLNPPIVRLGVMDLDSVIPPKDRTAFAMKLNALLASPSLSAWRKGQPLDLDAALGDGAGGTQTIFTLAHLGESERLFFLGLLLSELAVWVRRRPGSDALRALVVFDEVFGYFPPHPLNPPTKAPLLTLLKQARAFGVGLVLATQNPVDLDYKGLTNAGLWFLGRLQTEPDRNRVADALGNLPGGTSAADLLGTIQPRTFLVHDVKQDAPRLMQTRHCISYLAGPLAPPQLKLLLAPSPSLSSSPAPQLPSSIPSPAPRPPSSPAPSVPAGWPVQYGAGLNLVPHLTVEAEVAYKASPKSPPLLVRSRHAWPLKGSTLEFSLASDPAQPPQAQALLAQAPQGATCEPLPPYFGAVEPQKASKAAAASLALRQNLTLSRDPVTGTLQDPSEDEAAFLRRLVPVREQARRAEEAKSLKTLLDKLEKAEDRVRKYEHKVDSDKSEASARNTETLLSAGLGVLGGIFGSKRSIGGAVSRTASKYRQADRAKDRAEADEADLDAAVRERDQLKAEADLARAGLAQRYGAAALETVTLTPNKSGVQILDCRLIWF